MKVQEAIFYSFHSFSKTMFMIEFDTLIYIPYLAFLDEILPLALKKMEKMTSFTLKTKIIAYISICSLITISLPASSVRLSLIIGSNSSV